MTNIIKNTKPFFSILLPIYNREDFLAETIDTVLNQSFKDWELVAVDDGSTDKSVSILEAYGDDRIRIIKQKNAGAGAARNTAISNASGEYFAFLDSDDLWKPNHLELHHAAIVKSNFQKAFFRSFIAFIENGAIKDHQSIVENNFKDSLEYAMQVALYPTACSFHHSLFANIRFNEQIKINIDAECFIRVAAISQFFVIPEHTGLIRRHPGNLSVAGSTNYLRQIEVWSKIQSYPEVKTRLPRHYINNLLANYHFWLFADKKLSSQKRLYNFTRSVALDRRKLFKWQTWKLLFKSIIGT
ncbi:glycosyltransferase family 2 protein [Peijinzhouia sedimentorum]